MRIHKVQRYRGKKSPNHQATLTRIFIIWLHVQLQRFLAPTPLTGCCDRKGVCMAMKKKPGILVSSRLAILIYIYICVCVCVCVLCSNYQQKRLLPPRDCACEIVLRAGSGSQGNPSRPPPPLFLVLAVCSERNEASMKHLHAIILRSLAHPLFYQAVSLPLPLPS